MCIKYIIVSGELLLVHVGRVKGRKRGQIGEYLSHFVYLVISIHSTCVCIVHVPMHMNVYMYVNVHIHDTGHLWGTSSAPSPEQHVASPIDICREHQ